MYKAKTKETDASVTRFIESVEKESKKQDAYRLLSIFEEASGMEAKMWGDSIIGFGSYHYKYASGHEGDSMLGGFSPRKAKISLYMATGFPERERYLSRLGKHTSGKGCVYINKVDDIDTDVLKDFIQASIAFLTDEYG
ncbi:MAG: DUF1801 domain-containing protein [Alkalibacterium sp.]|nr:DUF1801 domain-containing protein [Alkalibacterium sp.]